MNTDPISQACPSERSEESSMIHPGGYTDGFFAPLRMAGFGHLSVLSVQFVGKNSA
jgi:hypothetical protein